MSRTQSHQIETKKRNNLEQTIVREIHKVQNSEWRKKLKANPRKYQEWQKNQWINWKELKKTDPAKFKKWEEKVLQTFYQREINHCDPQQIQEVYNIIEKAAINGDPKIVKLIQEQQISNLNPWLVTHDQKQSQKGENLSNISLWNDKSPLVVNNLGDTGLMISSSINLLNTHN